MNGKRKFTEYITLEGENFSKELLDETEQELKRCAEGYAEARGSRLIRSSIEIWYEIRKGYMDVHISWTELFTENN